MKRTSSILAILILALGTFAFADSSHTCQTPGSCTSGSGSGVPSTNTNTNTNDPSATNTTGGISASGIIEGSLNTGTQNTSNSNSSTGPSTSSATGGSSNSGSGGVNTSGITEGAINTGTQATGGAGGSSSSNSSGGSVGNTTAKGGNATGGSSSSNSGSGSVGAFSNGNNTGTQNTTGASTSSATNGSVNDNSKTTNTNTALGGTSISAGGQGGQGGKSSSSSGVLGSGNSASISQGGKVSGSGNSSVGNLSTGPSTSSVGAVSSTLANSGNSANNVSSRQGQGQGQSQQSSSNNTGGNSSNSYSSVNNVEAPKIPVASALAPAVIPTVPCLKGYSGAGQGLLAGAGAGFSKIDGGCDAREYARFYADLLHSRVAACKMLVSQKRSKKAGVTLEDCMQQDVVVAPAPTAAIIPPTPQPVQVSVLIPPQAIAVVPSQPAFVASVARMDNVTKQHLDEAILLVSNFGRVRSRDRLVRSGKAGSRLNRGRLLKVTMHRGYAYITFIKRPAVKTCQVHRLVALAFIPNPKNKPQVNHKKAPKTNNHVTNLEWATSAEDAAHKISQGFGTEGSKNGQAKLTEAQVIEMRQLRAEGWTQQRLGFRFNITKSMVSLIVRGDNWRHLQPLSSVQAGRDAGEPL